MTGALERPCGSSYTGGVQLRDLGEFGLIARIERRFGGARGPAVVLGIGDDAAVLRLRAGEQVVASCDAFVEDVHFRFSDESPTHVGRRAAVAALSDLAAMGARPLGCTLAMTAPPTLAVACFDALVGGVAREAARHGAPLVGGNLARARETTLSLAVLGAVAPGRALTRRGVRVGDRICVTGALGAAALDRARAVRGARVRHLARPRLAAGRALARRADVVACIDLSDGLEADLGHLLGPALALEPAAAPLPLPRGFERACGQLGLDAEQLARRGGEDYELLFALRGRASLGPLARALRLPVHELGCVRRARRGAGGAAGGGWRHF